MSTTRVKKHKILFVNIVFTEIKGIFFDHSILSSFGPPVPISELSLCAPPREVRASVPTRDDFAGEASCLRTKHGGSGMGNR